MQRRPRGASATRTRAANKHRAFLSFIFIFYFFDFFFKLLNSFLCVSFPLSRVKHGEKSAPATKARHPPRYRHILQLLPNSRLVLSFLERYLTDFDLTPCSLAVHFSLLALLSCSMLCDGITYRVWRFWLAHSSHRGSPTRSQVAQATT